jgi:hypothetical protein
VLPTDLHFLAVDGEGRLLAYVTLKQPAGVRENPA